MLPRYSSTLGAGLVFLLGACSAEPAQEEPVTVVYTRISLASPRRVAAAPDTLTPGQPYVRKLFLTSNAFKQMAAALHHPYVIEAKAFLDSQPRTPLDATLIGDTCYLKLNPATVPDTGLCQLNMRFAIDYMPSKRTTDTTFILVDRVIVRK